MQRPSKRTARVLILAIPLVALCVSIAAGLQGNKAESQIEWHEAPQEVLGQGGPYAKPVMLRFHANWCGPCRTMDVKVWPNEEVETLVNQNYIPIELNIDNPAAARLARTYDVRGVPTIITLDKNGNETGRANFMTATQTLRLLKRGLEKTQ